ncbi:hypothetical protein GOP47_0020561 [Adiantum capillus-veneris]|uniref:Uncharacterized protein n=1 Tax=Adiantum capillus-veneris TaxID=13818 RepID=A0A9D4U9D0_ADICA|nr:hypothetical protein GOP47_0020561 [Adiantum capillus-veneris]
MDEHNDDDEAETKGEELLAPPLDEANENDVDEEEQNNVEDEEEEEIEEENDDEDDCLDPYADFDELGLHIDCVIDMELVDDDVVDD